MNHTELDDLIGEALTNIRQDRKAAKEFLNEIATQIAKDPDHNKHLSPVAAKHVETMQRSNEQLVKIIGMIHTEKEEDTSLTEEDKEGLFDMIQEPK